MGKQMSRSSYDKLVLELDDLKINKRKEVAERLKVARSYGDLSENAEYDEAKNEQAILEAKIAELQHTIDNAEVIEESNISVDEILDCNFKTFTQLNKVFKSNPFIILCIPSVNCTWCNAYCTSKLSSAHFVYM